jgi:hypothetical protein
LAGARRAVILGCAIAFAVGAGWLFASMPAKSATGCTICATFVTSFDPDGPGGAAPRTRSHPNLIANVPYALDVDGNGAPLPLGILPLLPGYEVRTNVIGLDATRPEITVEKLLNAPPTLPLRIEVVTGGSPRFTSIGYDALGSSAPQSFNAHIDLSNRDGNAATSQARLDLTISGAAKKLTLVNEEFKGDPAGTRTERQIRRAEFEGNGLTTRVPTRSLLDLTTTSTKQQLTLTRDAATKLNFDIAEPGTGPRTTGTLDQLPPRVDLTLADVDVNGDDKLDKKIDYGATAVVGKAQVVTKTPAQTTDVTVDDLPSEGHLTYVSAPSAEDIENGAPDRTEVTYHANSRAKKAVVKTDDGKRKMVATVDNLPANIDELSSTSVKDGGKIVFASDGRATRGEVDVTEGPKHTNAVVTDLPADMSIDYLTDPAAGRAHYIADGVAERADVVIDDVHAQQTKIRVDGIPSDVLVEYKQNKAAGTLDVDYTANGDVPRAELHGTNLKGLPDRAKELHAVLLGVPAKVHFGLLKKETTTRVVNEVPPPEICNHIPNPEDDPKCPQHEDYEPPTETITTVNNDQNVALTTPGDGRLRSGEVQLTSGPDVRLPATAEKGNAQDGVLFHDLDDRYVAFARVSEFDQLTLTKHNRRASRTGPGLPQPGSTSEEMHAELDTSAEDHALALDLKQRESNGSVSSKDALLVTLPSHIELDTEKSSGLGEDRTNWTASRPVEGWDTSVIDPERRPGFSLVERTQAAGQQPVIKSRTTLDPMPTSFAACQHNLEACSEDRFAENVGRLRNGDAPYRTFACLAAGCGGSDFPFPGFPNDDARNGSFLLKSDVPTNLIFQDGDFFNRNGPYTEVSFRGLRRYGLQGHKRQFSCVFDQVTCKVGYVAMDTAGHPLEGSIRQQKEDSFTFLNFPAGFTADRLVWGFYKNNVLSGRVATVGALNCPDGTEVQVGGETLNERFCDGDLLEGGILDQF